MHLTIVMVAVLNQFQPLVAIYIYTEGIMPSLSVELRRSIIFYYLLLTVTLYSTVPMCYKESHYAISAIDIAMT